MKLINRYPLVSAALLGLTLGVGYMILASLIISPS